MGPKEVGDYFPFVGATFVTTTKSRIGMVIVGHIREELNQAHALASDEATTPSDKANIASDETNPLESAYDEVMFKIAYGGAKANTNFRRANGATLYKAKTPACSNATTKVYDETTIDTYDEAITLPSRPYLA